jgi:small redox-active disulfide protein 2
VSEDDVATIMIGKHRVGIIGLARVLEEMAEGYAQKEDDVVQGELLHQLSRKNYIPDRAKAAYCEAFLREFRKFVGQPFTVEKHDALEIKVLGPGCPQCDQLEMEVREIVAEINLAADLEHITDVKEIGKYGVMGSPALIINGKVKAVGRVPARDKIKNWLREAVT